MPLTLDIFIHLETLGRENWTGDFDACPLNEAGRRHAVRIAEELGAAPIQGIFSSPAVRCRESLEPLSERCGLPIVVLPVLRSAGGFPAPGPTWERPDRPPLGRRAGKPRQPRSLYRFSELTLRGVQHTIGCKGVHRTQRRGRWHSREKRTSV